MFMLVNNITFKPVNSTVNVKHSETDITYMPNLYFQIRVETGDPRLEERIKASIYIFDLKWLQINKIFFTPFLKK